ncbi:MAG: hypothetical protein MI974_23715 [Chitinophagales bacterium]|nr:hypothetical protein [Chitinophagales bacterium]
MESMFFNPQSIKIDEEQKAHLIKDIQSEKGIQLMDKLRTEPESLLTDLSTPTLATARDLVYKAYKRPYLGQASGGEVLILLANGWYYPTPGKVNMYFEQVYGKFEFKLMENNSSVGFFLATYHNADWTSGAGALDLPDTIIVEDANGKHTIPVESFE